MDVIITVLIGIAGFFALTIVLGCYFTVQQQSRAIVERFGKYVRTAKPGLNFKIPYIEGIVQRVSLRVQQLLVEVDTKTLDNVFVKISVAVALAWSATCTMKLNVPAFVGVPLTRPALLKLKPPGNAPHTMLQV